MKLVVTDTALKVPDKAGEGLTYVNLSTLKIAPCTGCFNCWVKTPTQCTIHDDATQIYPLIAKAEKLLYVSKIKYGSYDSVMKTMLERTIPILQAFIHFRNGESHHLYRDIRPKDATVIGYDVNDEEERQIFRDLVARNALHMNFEHHRVLFASRANLDSLVHKEVIAWTAC